MDMVMDEHIDDGLNQRQTLPNKKTIFGKYEMGWLLGKGTFAKVYSAKNIVTADTVAIKIVNKEKVKKAGMMDQIQREISVMRLVRHPNVVDLKEVMATRTRIYFVMEYIKGGELFAKVAKGKLKEEVARKYFQQLISAVDYCHSRGVSHRDLKLENLLLDENENLKVTDFGLSALPECLRHDGLLHTQCGTPAYVAPEVLKKKGYDGVMADIWSCGVILYVLISGYLPFQDENMMKMYERAFKADYKFPSWFPYEPSRVVAKLLVVDPNKRLTIQGIMRQPWFVKGFNPRLNPSWVGLDQEPLPKSSSSSPRFYNAFEFISSMSSGFDLSSLFESKRRVGSMFTSKCSASAIMAKIEGLAKKLNFQVSAKEFKLKMQGRSEGRKGRLAVEVEVFEVAAEVAVVEFSKCSGDTLEYVKFCNDDVRPTLKDIVWTWQGEK